jgi:hypothetical protein
LIKDETNFLKILFDFPEDPRRDLSHLKANSLGFVLILNTQAQNPSFRLCDCVVNNLGFGWLIALCAPGVHTGTVFLALRMLLTVTKHSPLMKHFKEGTANGGWLHEADAVIRNRAAILLGFSVSARTGAVGSHVDVNPELANCNGFAALEQLIGHHADQPFAYLTMLALLFNQHNANVQVGWADNWKQGQRERKFKGIFVLSRKGVGLTLSQKHVMSHKSSVHYRASKPPESIVHSQSVNSKDHGVEKEVFLEAFIELSSVSFVREA